MTGQTSTPAPPPAPEAEPHGQAADQLSGQRVLVVFNPKSGQGDSGLPAFLQLIRQAGAEVVERELNKDTSVDELVRDARTFNTVVAAGGDGTVSALAYATRDSNIPLLAFPAGTANLIAQNLDLPTDPEGLAKLLVDGHSIQVDLGEVEVEGHRRGFAMLAGAGADAAMIRDSEELKDRFGVLAYVMSAMKQLNPKKTVFSLVIDGQPREFEGIGVMVANFGMANHRMPITTHIDPQDGQFTVVLLKAGNLLRLVPNLIDSLRAKFHLGDPLFSDNLEILSAREITVDAVDPFPLQYDGELMVETTPFQARILPGAVRFITLATEEEVQT